MLCKDIVFSVWFHDDVLRDVLGKRWPSLNKSDTRYRFEFGKRSSRQYYSSYFWRFEGSYSLLIFRAVDGFLLYIVCVIIEINVKEKEFHCNYVKVKS